ncbi:MAG: hypothetical protein M1517_07780 [Deltaproteobacteria bacterium]|nr:hypothetical protein [Deltaproteobacteria bacterium]
MNKGYIDIHSHILYDVDDGASTLDESVQMIGALFHAGFSASFATPHNMPGNDREALLSRCRERIRSISGKAGGALTGYEILQGAENYFDASLDISDVASYFVPLGRSETFLVEIPFIGEVSHHIASLRKSGLRCIIAHVERYADIIQNPDRAHLFKQAGFLLQMNIGSLIGIYGFDVMKTAGLLLNAGIIDVMSTDIHDVAHADAVLNKGFKRLEAILSPQQVSRLLRDTPYAIAGGGHEKAGN